MKNPKTVIGLVVLAILLFLGGILVSRMIPTIRETRLEMSLTPTPLPQMPDNTMVVTPDPNAKTDPLLRRGSQGQAVTDLQSRLKTLGYYHGEIDGQYGDETWDAVMTFQAQNNLEADGVVGEDTKALLFSANAQPYWEPGQ